MIYELGDYRLSLDGYFFELDSLNNMHVYAKGMEYIDMVEIGFKIDLDEFKYRCRCWIAENK